MVRLYQRRWQVSVPSANANHNVVSLGLTSWWIARVSNPILLDISQLRYRYTSDP